LRAAAWKAYRPRIECEDSAPPAPCLRKLVQQLGEREWIAPRVERGYASGRDAYRHESGSGVGKARLVPPPTMGGEPLVDSGEFFRASHADRRYQTAARDARRAHILRTFFDGIAPPLS
jgi:hypothetical protein